MATLYSYNTLTSSYDALTEDQAVGELVANGETPLHLFEVAQAKVTLSEIGAVVTGGMGVGVTVDGSNNIHPTQAEWSALLTWATAAEDASAGVDPKAALDSIYGDLQNYPASSTQATILLKLFWIFRVLWKVHAARMGGWMTQV